MALALALVCLSACGRGSQDSNDGWNSDSFDADTGIIHGRSVTNRDQIGKTVVALVAQNQSGQALCTGSIISEDTILTAAHCVDHDIQELVVVFGQRVRGVKPENIRKAVSFVQNPRWKKSSDTTEEGNPRGTRGHAAKPKGRGDLALVHFEGGLPSGYQAVELAGRGEALDKDMSIVMVGYGVTDGVTSKGSGVLRETQTTLIGSHSATEFITDGQQSSVCFGDSGGPAFIEDGGHYVQIGVASSVMNQSCNQASVHTSVMGYGSWIKSASARLRKGSSTHSRSQSRLKKGKKRGRSDDGDDDNDEDSKDND